MLIVVGLILLHYLPILLYWDVIQSDGIIRDDTANPVIRANMLMFIWHMVITVGSIFVGITTLFNAIFNKMPRSNA